MKADRVLASQTSSLVSSRLSKAGWSHSEVVFQLPHAHTCTCRCPHTHQEKHWSLSKSPTTHLWMLQRYVFPKFPELFQPFPWYVNHYFALGYHNPAPGTSQVYQALQGLKLARHTPYPGSESLGTSKMAASVLGSSASPDHKLFLRTINYFPGPEGRCGIKGTTHMTILGGSFQ